MNISLNPPGSAELSLLSAVMSATRNATGTYTARIGAKDVDIRVITSGNLIRFALFIQEKAMSKVGNKNTEFKRNMTFTYKSSTPAAGAGISN